MSLSIQEKTRLIGFMSSNRSIPEHDFSNQPIYREKGREVIKDFEDRSFPHSSVKLLISVIVLPLMKQIFQNCPEPSGGVYVLTSF